jgi:uncharacterized protein YndB with AHSA1/START domain
MRTHAWLVIGTLALAVPAGAGDRILRTELTIEAAVSEVWEAWTTEDGARSFFAPGAHIEPEVDGLYEIHFYPDRAPGRRGAEGTRLLVYEPPSRLAFSWNAPLDLPHVRAQRTVVTIELDPEDAERTRLVFTQSGWGHGREWDRAYEYFDAGWKRVLARLVHRFEHGPIDWTAPPAATHVTGSLKVELVPR